MQRSGDVRPGSAPGVDINYGAFTNVQLHVQPQLTWVHDKNGNTIGVGDLELGVKYRMTPSDTAPEDLMVGVYPMLQVPTGNADKSPGAGARSLYLPLWLQTSRDAWTVYGGAGYRIDVWLGRKRPVVLFSTAYAADPTITESIDGQKVWPRRESAPSHSEPIRLPPSRLRSSARCLLCCQIPCSSSFRQESMLAAHCQPVRVE